MNHYSKSVPEWPRALFVRPKPFDPQPVTANVVPFVFRLEAGSVWGKTWSYHVLKRGCQLPRRPIPTLSWRRREVALLVAAVSQRLVAGARLMAVADVCVMATLALCSSVGENPLPACGGFLHGAPIISLSDCS